MALYPIDILQHTQIQQLLDLQSGNLISNISTDTAKTQGFLTFKYDVPLISRMMDFLPQPIALKDGEVVAYALATAKEVCLENDKLRPLIEVCEKLEYKGRKLTDYAYYTMGQTCVAESARGQGIFEGLYQKHKELFVNEFEVVITEISSKNTRSQAAHKRVGFETLYQYQQDATLWNVVVWNLKD